jgi:hypothetical protein
MRDSEAPRFVELHEGIGGDGKREKDRSLMGLCPVLVNPRTLVRTWGTQTELA